MFKAHFLTKLRFSLEGLRRPLLVSGFSTTCLLLSSCSSNVLDVAMPEASTDNLRHISAPAPSSEKQNIPEIVTPLPLLSEPQLTAEPELYSVVAQDQPVRELLFAMARDAAINIDIHPGIAGQISINAIDQTLPQILERVAHQVDLRWHYDESGNLLVEPDSAYWHVYKIDYVNVNRSATTSVNISNSIANVGGSTNAGANNDSSAEITQTSTNNFWGTLTQNLSSLLNESSDQENPSVVANPESSIINVRANSKQHQGIQSFLDIVHSRALQEVLIEATIVEVSLNDDFQSGVDWQTLARNSGKLNFSQSLTGAALSNAPFSSLTISNGSGTDPYSSADDDISATVKLLSEFGDLKVLSSPKLMALNNQPAMLRVVDNTVYFSIDVEPAVQNATGGIASPATFSSNLHTVPVGLVMTITPQISETNQVTLNVRPTISRVVRFVNDPNPQLATAGVVNPVPEVQIREIESLLKVYSGETAVLGGLMQDSLSTSTNGLPGASRLPGLRNLFSARDDSSRKTELIIFIRPIIATQPSLNGDLEQYRDFLPESSTEFFNQNSFIQPLN